MATVAERQRWMGILAKALPAELEKCVTRLGELPAYGFLRSPEIGLAMVRGKAGGVGNAFNLGEITLTRCVVQLNQSDSSAKQEAEEGAKEAEKAAGFGYVAGRSHRHAELAALCDALLQQEQWHGPVMSKVVDPLQAGLQASIAKQQQQTASTQVEFFTMLRGE